jgi:hypothetical protein
MKGIREMKGSFLVENVVLHHLSQFRVANTAWCHTHALMLFKVWTHKAHLKCTCMLLIARIVSDVVHQQKKIVMQVVILGVKYFETNLFILQINKSILTSN